MLRYLLCCRVKSIKVSAARHFFNNRHLTRKRRNRLLAKSGVVFRGESSVTPPFFYEFGRITFGNNVYINAGCVFLDHAAITIDDNALIGPNVTLSTASHAVEPSQRNSGVISAPITLGANVWLGAGVVVLPVRPQCLSDRCSVRRGLSGGYEIKCFPDLTASSQPKQYCAAEFGNKHG